MKRLVDWLPVALGVLLLITLAALQRERIAKGQNDFVALYAGARLVGTPDLYSRAANLAVSQEVTGITMKSVVYTRPPFYACLLKPLSALPYLTAYALFCLVCVASVLWFVVRFTRDCPALPLYAAFSIPVAAVLPQGQDTPFLLVFTGTALLLHRAGRPFLAGMMLALCAIKFHLFLLVPLLLVMKREWRTLAGGAAGGGVLLLLTLLLAGPSSLPAYLAVLRDPWINFTPDMMPNLHGFAAILPAALSTPVETGLVLFTLAAFFWACSRSDSYEFLFALTLIGGLLVSFHSGISDQVLLLPAFVLLFRTCEDKYVRLVFALTLTPVPYFTGLGVNVIMPLLLLAVLILAARAATRVAAAPLVERAAA